MSSRTAPRVTEQVPKAFFVGLLVVASCTTTTIAKTPTTSPLTVDPREPDRSKNGSDISSAPKDLPTGEWLPLLDPLISLQVRVEAEVNGETIPAILDTGAMRTVVSEPVAARLGLPRGGKRIPTFDAHGTSIPGRLVRVRSVSLGRFEWREHEVMVVSRQPSLFLIGADILADLDLFILSYEGLLGVFPPGQAPRGEDQRVVGLVGDARQLRARATADGKRGKVPFELILDTGATNTHVPLLAGINGGLKADLTFVEKTHALGGVRETRGRFRLEPLYLNQHVVGRVLAFGRQSGDAGLLGNDILARQPSIVSFRSRELRFGERLRRPPFRTLGPGNRACADRNGRATRCVTVSLATPTEAVEDDALPDVCLNVEIGEVYAGQTVELAVLAHPPGGDEELFNGGALRVFVTVSKRGFSRCFTLWQQLERFGFDRRSEVELVWMRTDGVTWPCDPLRTECLSFSGSL